MITVHRWPENGGGTTGDGGVPVPVGDTATLVGRPRRFDLVKAIVPSSVHTLTSLSRPSGVTSRVSDFLRTWTRRLTGEWDREVRGQDRGKVGGYPPRTLAKEETKVRGLGSGVDVKRRTSLRSLSTSSQSLERKSDTILRTSDYTLENRRRSRRKWKTLSSKTTTRCRRQRFVQGTTFETFAERFYFPDDRTPSNWPGRRGGPSPPRLSSRKSDPPSVNRPSERR